MGKDVFDILFEQPEFAQLGKLPYNLRLTFVRVVEVLHVGRRPRLPKSLPNVALATTVDSRLSVATHINI